MPIIVLITGISIVRASLAHFPNSVCRKHAAADAYQRLFSLFQRRVNALYLHEVALYGRLIAANIHAFGVLELYKLFLNVHRYVYQHGAGSAGARDVKCFFKDTRYVLGIAYQIAVLYERLSRAGNISLLKSVAAYLAARHLTRNADYRDRVGVSSRNSCNKVNRARAGSRYAYGRLSRHSRISAGFVAAVRFVTNEDMAYIGVKQCVVKWAYRRAGITEDDLYILRN